MNKEEFRYVLIRGREEGLDIDELRSLAFTHLWNSELTEYDLEHILLIARIMATANLIWDAIVRLKGGKQ